MTSELMNRAGFSYQMQGRVGAGKAIVALHGSGVDESTVLPLASAIDPEALIIAPRGRVDQNGERRWFLKHSPVDFVQRSIRAESRAFAAFIRRLYSGGELDPKHTIFLGYSNGGNLVHSTMLLHPGCIAKAVLLRCMPVLKTPPATDLTGKSGLVIAGERDATYGPFGPALAALLRDRGAAVQSATVAAGHEFGEEDAVVIRKWLSMAAADEAPPVA